MSYGTIGADVIQTSGANLAPVFKDLNDSVVGTLPKNAQIAKAWVNFNGTLSGTITPRAAYNVTSVTKNGTGLYTINFTNAMSDTNYVDAVSGWLNDTYTSVHPRDGTTPRTTTSIVIRQPSGVDLSGITVTIFGN